MAAPENDPLVIAREQEQALDLFIQGKDYRYIAQAIGRSVSTAHKRVQDALHESRRLKAREYVDVELALYQQLQDRLMQRLAHGVPPEKIAPELVRLSKERRRLLGLDAPKQVSIHLPDAPAVAEVGFARVVEEAERAAAAEEQEIREDVRDAG